jgi:hypothetical protein
MTTLTIADVIQVRPGFYRCGVYCLHRGHNRWSVYRGAEFVKMFSTLRSAREWAMENQP